MKVGSIVAVRKLPEAMWRMYHNILWLPVQDEKTPYVIKEIGEDGGHTVATLEEGIIAYHPSGDEYGIPIIFLIELLPPEEVSIDMFISESIET